ncbi:Exocyst complex component SEC6, partial [Striga hermonthica]
ETCYHQFIGLKVREDAFHGATPTSSTTLCLECQTLIESHDHIKLLSNARNDLYTASKDVEGIMSIFVETAEARDSLSDDKEPINTYE